MRPFDDIPLEESDYSDVALLMAGVREWPNDDFTRELDSRVERRFEPEAAPAGRMNRSPRGRLSRWTAGPAVAVLVGAVAAVVVLTGGGTGQNPQRELTPSAAQISAGAGKDGVVSHGARFGAAQPRQHRAPAPDGVGAYAQKEMPVLTTASGGASTGSGASGQGANLPAVQYTEQGSPSVSATSAAPVAPGAKQIRSAQLSLSTPNVHVNQVAQEIFGVVSSEHGTVLNSHIATATRSAGGGYAYFSLSIPTANLQDTMTQLSRLHYVAVLSSENNSQNVSRQYNGDQHQLADAEALRSSLLKQLAAATTTQEIDSIKAQLKLAEQQIASWQSTLGALQHRISYSNLSVQVNQNGLPVPVYSHHVSAGSSGFTIGRAGHDALRVLVVSAGVALIALAVLIPVGLVAALLVWLWVWLRQRRREHALDTAS
jgi:hypothetical protein